MNNWREEKAWSDQFLPEIKKILGIHLIGEPPVAEDMERNTDLMVLNMRNVRIGCRVRRFKYYKYYHDEFTIRQNRSSKYKTELTKIVESWGRYFFYAFADENDDRLIKWTLADMNIFRLEWSRYLANNNGKLMGKQQSNGSGDSDFRSFKWDSFPRSFIVSTNKLKVA